MQIRTHIQYGILFGLALWFVLNSFLDAPAPLIYVGFAIIGALAPDIDHVKAEMGMRFPMIARIIEHFSHHRGFTHYLGGAAIIWGAAGLLLFLGKGAAEYVPLALLAAFFLYHTKRQGVVKFIAVAATLFYAPIILFPILTPFFPGATPALLDHRAQMATGIILAAIYVRLNLDLRHEGVRILLAKVAAIIALMLPAIVNPAPNAWFYIWGSFVIGYVSHLFIDLLNPSGIRLLSPFSTRQFRMLPLWTHLPAYTGTWRGSDVDLKIAESKEKLREKLKAKGYATDQIEEYVKRSSTYRPVLLEKHYFWLGILLTGVVCTFSFGIPGYVSALKAGEGAKATQMLSESAAGKEFNRYLEAVNTKADMIYGVKNNLEVTTINVAQTATQHGAAALRYSQKAATDAISAGSSQTQSGVWKRLTAAIGF